MVDNCLWNNLYIGYLAGRMVELLWGHGAKCPDQIPWHCLGGRGLSWLLVLHPISCTCLATPPAVGHFLSYIRDKFGCYAHPFWNLLLRDMCHEKSAWRTNLAAIFFQSLVSVWWSRSQVLPISELAQRESSGVTPWRSRRGQHPSSRRRGHWPFWKGLKWKHSCNSICVL